VKERLWTKSTSCGPRVALVYREPMSMEGDRAHRSSACGRIGHRGFAVRGLGGGEEAGDSIFVLIGGREAAESAGQQRTAVAAFGARWGGTWSVREGKWRWKAGVVDEGEHLGAFYRPAEEGSGQGGARSVR
jgi:hypothetical protein